MAPAAEVPPPLRADARRNRAKVLAAARAAFAEQGVLVALTEIARRAGVGAGTVYRHFPSKEALFAAVVADQIDHVIADARGLLDRDDPGAAFYDFFATVIEQTSVNKALCEALEAAGDISVDTATATATDVRHAFGAVFGGLLARAQRAGAVRDDVDLADVRALLAGCLAARRHRGEAGPVSRLATVLCDGLRPPR
ncbi:TetR/AcrR family transcriptional regulator [Actinophytocola sediminis]